MERVFVAQWSILWDEEQFSYGVLGVTTTREAAVALIADAVEDYATRIPDPYFEGDIPPRDNSDVEEWLAEALEAATNVIVEWSVLSFVVR